MEDACSDSIETLSQWLDRADTLIDDLLENATERGVRPVFSIGTTVKAPPGRRPGLTPLRTFSKHTLAGSLVFSTTQAVCIAAKLQHRVPTVLIDVEQKLDATEPLDWRILSALGIHPPPMHWDPEPHLSRLCAPFLAGHELWEFKPNDLTVQTTWLSVAQALGVLNGSKIAILGTGNIGFKLSLKLVESGACVAMWRRQQDALQLFVQAINQVKPTYAEANAIACMAPQDACQDSQAIIGTTAGQAIIDAACVHAAPDLRLVIDVGKGSITPDGIEACAARGVPVVRCDVTAALDGFLTALSRERDVQKNQRGRAELMPGVFVVSGGYLGKDGDVIVNNYKNPTRVIGVADGRGDLKRQLGQQDRQALAKLRTRTQPRTQLESVA